MSEAATAGDRRALVATMAVAVLLGLFAMNDLPVGVFQDDGHYLILARAIARGDGYRYMNLPGSPPATHFPPGYPLLLAPLWWLAPDFPANVALFKLVNVAMLPLAAAGVRAFARRVGGLSATAASLVAIASMATVPVLFLNGLIFSETAFIAALCAVLIGAERLATRDDDASWRVALGVGLSVGALAMLRTLGVAVLPALLTVLLWRRRWLDAALTLAGALVFLAPWQLWTMLHAREIPSAIAGAYGAYGTWLVDAYREGGASFALQVLRENVHGFLIPLTLVGLIDAPRWAQGIAVGAFCVLAGAGVHRLWPRARVSILCFVPYGALLLAWPFPPDRFLWPLWPLVLVALVVGTKSLGWGASVPMGARVTARVAAAGLAVLFVAWHGRNWRSRSWEDLERGNAKVGIAAASVAVSLPRDALVASDQDAMVHLYAGRPAVPLLALTAAKHVHPRTDAELITQLDGVLGAYHPRWVLVVERESLRAAQLLTRRGRLRLVGADPSGVLLYDVLP